MLIVSAVNITVKSNVILCGLVSMSSGFGILSEAVNGLAITNNTIGMCFTGIQLQRSFTSAIVAWNMIGNNGTDPLPNNIGIFLVALRLKRRPCHF
jgi:hypothetical protein